MEKSEAILSLLPTRLKEARQAQGLSLDAVAKLSGVSRSMVSQIERGESSPTIATLWNLTQALRVDFAGLLDGSQSPKIEVLRAGEVPEIDNHGTGCIIRILSSPEEVGKHEVYELRFGPNGVLDSQPHSHGTREYLTVIEGQLTVTSGEDQESLSAGDTARYGADLPHKITAIEASRAFLIVKSG